MKSITVWSVTLVLALVAFVGASALAGPGGGNTVLRNTVLLNASVASVTGGSPVDLTVSQAYPAVVDTPIAITTNQVDAFSSIPSYVVIAAGTTSVTFTAITAPVSSTVKATVVATLPDASTGSARVTITQ